MYLYKNTVNCKVKKNDKQVFGNRVLNKLATRSSFTSIKVEKNIT